MRGGGRPARIARPLASRRPDHQPTATIVAGPSATASPEGAMTNGQAEHDPFLMTAEGGGAAPAVKGGTVDWIAVKRAIFERLDLIAEFRTLGVRFTGQGYDSRGVAECHAIDRADESPSAC